MGFALLFSATAVLAQDPPKSPLVSASGDNVEISYSQPSKRGRVIFGELVPYDKVWRAGANMSTDITFKKDVTFGGKKVPAGSYALFIIPTEKEFTVILNSQTKQMGSSQYEANKSKNVAEVKVPRQKTAASVEKLTYSFPKGALQMEWDDTKISVPLKS